MNQFNNFAKGVAKSSIEETAATAALALIALRSGSVRGHCVTGPRAGCAKSCEGGRAGSRNPAWTDRILDLFTVSNTDKKAVRQYTESHERRVLSATFGLSKLGF